VTPEPRPGPRTAKELLRHARWRQWPQLLAASGLAVGNQASEVLVPVVVGVVVDRALVTGDRAALGRWIVVLVALYLVQSLCDRYGQRRTHLGAVLVEQDLRLGVLRRVVAPVGGAERGRLPGELVAITTTDVWRIAFVNYLVPLAAAALVGVAVGAAALLASSIPVGLTALLAAPVVLLAVHALGRPLQARNEAQQERAAEATGVAVDLVRGVRVLKGIGAETPARARYRTVSRRSLGAALALARADAAHQGGVVLLNGLYLVLVGTVGLVQASHGNLTAGQLVAVIGVAQLLLGPMATVAELSAATAAGRAAAGRVATVLSAPPAVAAGVPDGPEPSGAGALRFDGVRAGPLVDLSLAVAPGEVLGLVTDDPAVAAAVVRCLSREQDPDAGTIALDGVALTDLDPERARAAMVATVHDSALFGDSVAATLASLGADEEAAAEAVAAAQLDDVIQTLPDGLATVLAERGRTLSGGQRQRVALARALAARSPVLVLHEPTTAVDPMTERRIADGLRRVRAGRTTVLVTTSPTLLGATDRVVVLTGGRVAAEGAHADLLGSDPAYRDLVLA
jgi:putative ABC transport system ATP-binding protein